MTASRRDFLKRTGALAAAAGGLGATKTSAADLRFTPEPGAKLRLLRWKRFVQGDEEQWLANTRRFTQLSGVGVQIDSENWEEVRPKAAVAANVGAGPDIIIATDEQPHLYPDKLIDLTDLAEYLGRKYGGWYDTCREYGMHAGRWIAIPTGAAGGTMVYRRSHVQAAGFEQFPKDFPGFLALCQAQGAPHACRVRARPRHRGRQLLDLMDTVGARWTPRRREQPRRDQLPRDHRRAGICQGAVQHFRAGLCLVAGPEQQQSVPRG